MAEAELTPKEVGGFRILRRLASGATSDVLLARAEGPHGFQRVVALKILLARTKAEPDFERHFAREASGYARLSHPAIVKLYDFFAADGQLVMVLEFVDGLPLHKLRAMLAIAGERVDNRAALFLGLRVFSALAAAHAARDPATSEFAPVAHHDLNPSNVLVPWDGHVKVGDFGIAKAVGVLNDTRSGFVKGTYGYIAPEQAANEPLSVRADVYSAGLILWELLARRKAVQRGSLSEAEVMKAMATPDFPTLDLLRPDIDPAVRDAVRRTLEPVADKRSITAEDMVNVLRQAIPGDEGRVALTKALGRIRPATAVDPLAATQTREVRAPGGAVDRVDPEQTAPFAALGDEGDLGKIAFYGRINLPTRSDQPAVAPVLSSDPIAEPRTLPTPVVPPPDDPIELSKAVAGLPSEAEAKMRKLTPTRFVPRAIPRPLLDRKPSTFPTVPAGPLDEEDSSTRPKLASGRHPKLAPSPHELFRRAPSPGASTAPDPGLAKVEALSAVGSPPVPAFTPSDAGGNPPAADEPEVGLSVPPSPPDALLSPASLPPEAKSPSGLPPPVETLPGLQALAEGPASVDETPEPARSVAPPVAPGPARPPAPVRRFRWAPVVAGGLLLASGGAVLFFVGGTPAEDAAVPLSTSSTTATSATPLSTPPASSAEAPSAPLPLPAAAASPALPAVPAPSDSPPAAASAPVASTPAPPPSAPIPPASSLASVAAPEPDDSGEIDPPAAAAGHRVFIDGKVAGEGLAPIHVHCGSHTVRVGSAGTDRKVVVPCGGTLNLGP